MRGQAVIQSRREGALERLRESKFFEKGSRTEEAWQKRKDKEIERLEVLLNIRIPKKAGK